MSDALNKKTIQIIKDEQRLDVFLSQELSLTRSYIKQLIENENILLNLKPTKAGATLKKGDSIQVFMPMDRVCKVVPEDLDIEIIYEDDDIAVINKRQGMTVHPGGGAFSGTLVNALMYKLKNLSSINGEIRPGIVHRLDKDTSGVMVIAKNNHAHLNLSEQIKSRTVEKIYTALLEGVLNTDAGTIKTFIGRNPKNRKLMAVLSSGREAVTKYKVLNRFKAHTLAEFNILTGRTHQIRVHAKHIGHPIVGDKSYGLKKQRFNLSGQLLHSSSLTIVHPVSGERVTFTAPLPSYFKDILNIIKGES